MPQQDAGGTILWWDVAFTQMSELSIPAVKELVNQLGDAYVGEPGFTNFLRTGVKVWNMQRQLRSGDNKFNCCQSIYSCFVPGEAGVLAFFALLKRANISARCKGSDENIW